GAEERPDRDGAGAARGGRGGGGGRRAGQGGSGAAQHGRGAGGVEPVADARQPGRTDRRAGLLPPAGVPAGAAAAGIRALSLHAGPSGYVEVLFMTCPVLQPGSNGMVGSYGVLTSLGDSGGTLSTDANGQIAFLRVQLEAARKGAVVLVPTTPVRYDL